MARKAAPAVLGHEPGRFACHGLPVRGVRPFADATRHQRTRRARRGVSCLRCYPGCYPEAFRLVMSSGGFALSVC
jgi:hypothetical protein